MQNGINYWCGPGLGGNEIELEIWFTWRKDMVWFAWGHELYTLINDFWPMNSVTSFNITGNDQMKKRGNWVESYSRITVDFWNLCVLWFIHTINSICCWLCLWTISSYITTSAGSANAHCVTTVIRGLRNKGRGSRHIWKYWLKTQRSNERYNLLAWRRNGKQIRTEQMERSLVCRNVLPRNLKVGFLSTVVVADFGSGMDGLVAFSNHVHNFGE